ncbi:MAG: DUF222 domain-containing protein [Bdellovibrionota bacterium]
MNNLKTLPAQELLSKTKTLAAEERRITAEILQHLREIERRKLYADCGFSSLHAYCVGELQYSEASAQRRIESMRLLRELPELEGKIREGSLNLTTVAMVGTFCKKVHHSTEQKRELLLKVENQSKRETEKILASIAPEAMRRDSERAVSEDLVEVRMTIPRTVLKKIQRVRELTSHQNPDPTYAELLGMLSEEFLKKHAPERQTPRITPPAECRTRYIKRADKSDLHRQSESSCSFVDEKSGRRCGSRHFVQIDHIEPFALGGPSERTNLRLLCHAHNQLERRRLLS